MTDTTQQSLSNSATVNNDLALTIPQDLGGLRLDVALQRLLPEHSRSRLQAWIKEGLVKVGGQASTSKTKVWGGEQVLVQVQTKPEQLAFKAEDIPLNIVFEDDHILVINKPAGMVVHPAAGNWTGTLLNALLFHAPALKDVPRAGIVHRLDKDTSGLLVVAKTLAAQTNLVRQLQARTVKRAVTVKFRQPVYWQSDNQEGDFPKPPPQLTRLILSYIFSRNRSGTAVGKCCRLCPSDRPTPRRSPG